MHIAQGNEACMIIEEAIAIHAPIEKVWDTFTDLTCWLQWNTVIRNVRSEEHCLSNGKEVKCSLYPFLFPITVNLRIEELIPHELIVWSARKKGLYARHEFIFEKQDNSVLVTSRETFTGLLSKASGALLPKRKMQALTTRFLKDLRKASEEGG
jgi:hypothetical protein